MTVTFRVFSAPYLVVHTIHQLANDESAFDVICRILKCDLYVNDLLTSANFLEEILKIRNEIIEVLGRGGFDMSEYGIDAE